MLTNPTIDDLMAAVCEVDFNDEEMASLADELMDIFKRRQAIVERNASNGKSYAALVALAVYRATQDASDGVTAVGHIGRHRLVKKLRT
jgi:hypothetical protein